MKYKLLIILLLIPLSPISAQVDKTDDFYFTDIEDEISQLIEKARNLGKSDPARQLKLAIEAYNLALDEDSFENQADALATIGKAYFHLQEIDKSFQSLTECSQLSKRINYIDGQWYSGYLLGILNLFLEDLEKAIFYFEGADALLTDENDPGHIPLYRELAGIYKQMNLYEKAVSYSDNALSIASAHEDKESIFLMTLLSGDVHFEAGDIRKAFNLYKSIANETASFGDFQNIRTLALSQKGKCHALLGDFHLALAAGQDALLLSAKNDFLEGRVNAYESLAFIYNKMDDYEQAYENLQLFYKHKETLSSESSSDSLSKIKAYYGTFEKEQEIDKQQLQIQNQNRLILIGSLMIAVFLILILILYLLYKRNSRIALQLSRELKQEILLSRTDSVTGLPNKKDIEDKIQKAIMKWKKNYLDFSLILISFESFKKIDKDMGEGTGTDMQKYISRLLKTELKGQDTISLWKPFIYLLLLPETDNASLQSVTHRIKLKISNEIFTHGEKKIPLTLKMGSCTYSGDGNRSDCIGRCQSELSEI